MPKQSKKEVVEETIIEETAEEVESDSDDTIEEEVVEKVNETQPLIEVPKKVKAKAKPRTKKATIKSKCGADIVIKKPTAKKPAKVIEIAWEDIKAQYESSEDEAPKIVIKKANKKVGRPKSKKIIKYVDSDGDEVDDKMKANKTIINAPDNKPLSEKELKILELQEKIVEMEAMSGKKIRATKKNAVDKRQTKARTPAQIAASKKLVELNKLRKAEKEKQKAEKKKEDNKDLVENTLSELASLKAHALKVKKQKEEAEKAKAPKVDTWFD